MKRSILTYVGILGATYVGILGLSQCFPSQALAAGQEQLCYSTGPLENAFGAETLPGQSTEVFVKVLNNSSKTIEAEVLVFSLDGNKRLNFSDQGQIAPHSSPPFGPIIVDVADKLQFEVQVELEGAEPNSVLLGVFGKDKEGKLVAAHRVVHSEFTRIPCANNNT